MQKNSKLFLFLSIFLSVSVKDKLIFNNNNYEIKSRKYEIENMHKKVINIK